MHVILKKWRTKLQGIRDKVRYAVVSTVNPVSGTKYSNLHRCKTGELIVLTIDESETDGQIRLLFYSRHRLLELG